MLSMVIKGEKMDFISGGEVAGSEGLPLLQYGTLITAHVGVPFPQVHTACCVLADSVSFGDLPSNSPLRIDMNVAKTYISTYDL